jgi:hypothetical protein
MMIVVNCLVFILFKYKMDKIYLKQMLKNKIAYSNQTNLELK